MNKADLITALAVRTGASRADAGKSLDAVLDIVQQTLARGEEINIAGGTDDPLSSLRRIRAISSAVLVLKRGPMGCVVYPGAIPVDLEDGIVGRPEPARGKEHQRSVRQHKGNGDGRKLPADRE